MADNNLRQKLARCVNDEFPAKTKITSLKKVFGNMQDPHAKQSAQLKNSLVANGAIDVLISIMRCSDPSGPKFNLDQNIFQKGAPEWTAEFVLQADAVLAMRRLLEVGITELETGPRRVEKAVAAGVIDVLVPHMYCTSCAAQYASGAVKVISMYEEFRQQIVDAGALPPMVLLMTGDIEVEKSSFRQAAECLHLLSCSSTENFEELGVLAACQKVALDGSGGEKPVLLSVLCAANATAGQDDEETSKKMEEIYRQVQLGVHLCRWLNTSLDEKQKPYFTIKCSQLDMLRSVCLLAASDVGRLQLVNWRVTGCVIKDDGTQKKLTMPDILLKILLNPAQGDQKSVDVILEIFLHLAFSEQGASLIRDSEACMSHLHLMTESPSDVTSAQRALSARNILSVLKGKVGLLKPSTPRTRNDAKKKSNVSRAPVSPRTPEPVISRSRVAVESKNRKKMKKKVKEAEVVQEKAKVEKIEKEEEEEEQAEEEDEEQASIANDDDDNDDDSDDQTEDEQPARSLPPNCLESGQALPHIMISYCWAHQEVIIEICQHLKAAGLPYWLDIEQMHGEINDRMAEAIESCGVVIVGVSSKYKLSANCRMEAEYSNASGKIIVPLMMEKGYRANGWLGLLIAGKLWYGVSSDESNRQANIASMVDVVTAAVKREAAVMSPECLARSLALFTNTSSQETPPITDVAIEGQQSHHVNSTESTAVTALKEGPGPVLFPPSSSGLTLDAVTLLIDQMQVKLQASIAEQLRPVVDTLSGIESRLDKIESNMKKL